MKLPRYPGSTHYPPIMENQMEKNMEETEVTRGLRAVTKYASGTLLPFLWWGFLIQLEQ